MGEADRSSPEGCSELAEPLDGVGIVIDGAFVTANDELAEVFGFAESAAIVGSSWEELYPDGARKRIERAVRSWENDEGAWRGEVEGVRPDGSTFSQVLAVRGDGEDRLLWIVRRVRGGGIRDESPERLEEPDLQTTPGQRGRDSEELGGSRKGELSQEIRPEGQFIETIIDVLDDILYVIDEDGEPYLWNETLVETTGYTHEEIAAMRPADFLPEPQHEYSPGLMEAIDALDDRRVELDLVAEDGEPVPHEFKGTTFEDPVTGEVYRCGIARDITERLERERELKRQRDELSALDRINELLFEVVDELVETTTRDAVEEMLCERLAESELYQFAWSGERKVQGDDVVLRVSAGDGGGYLASIVDAEDGTLADAHPAGRAIQTGEVQAANVDSAAFDPRRAEARERGVESVISVPLRHRDTTYGVLSVYATRPDAFSVREQTGFAVLGQAAGYAIDAIQRRRLLFADAVTELTFRISDDEAFLARVSREFGCRLTIPGHMSAGDRWILYVEVDGVATGRIVETAAEDPAVTRARHVGDEGNGQVELVVSETSLVRRTIPTGSRVRSIKFEDGVGRLVVESPAEAKTRDVVEQFEATFDSVELLAQRELDREPEAPPAPGRVLDGLTDRQREAIEAAYRAGYFDWPRRSKAREVAEALGVADATFLAHIRKAERTLISRFFD